jgi:hypothetical protein
MKLFRYFRRHGVTVNFNAYRLVNEELTELCEKLTQESFKQYCSTLNCHSSLKVQRRSHVDDFSWLPKFAERMAPLFSRPNFHFHVV